MKKINLSNENEVRERVATAIKKMTELVGMTLGPSGRSVIIERPGEPLIVDDGRRVAENIKLDDPVGQLAVRVCYNVTRKTDEKVGDGTTTSMILTNAILSEIYNNFISMGGIGKNVNLNEIDLRIQNSKNEIIKLLDESAKQVKTEKELIDVATISVGDAELGKIIGGIYYKLGKDGHITLEFNLLSNQIETEIVSGYRFSGGYAADWMISDSIKKICDISDTHVLISRSKLTDIQEILPITNVIANSGKNKMVIIAPQFSPSVLKHIYTNATRKNSPFFILCVRAPARTEEAYKDMAIYTGGKYFSENDDLKTATKEDIGYVSRIEVNEDTCILIEGKGKPEDIKKRVKEVEAEAKVQKIAQFKQDRLERASALSGGVGLIKIGAPTDEERNWLKYKIEDAKHATKHAYRDGIVKGGGLAFVEISEKLPDSNILKKAILAPHEKLKENAGGPFTIGKDVIDPVAVEKAALENACSAASKLIRIGGAITSTPGSLVDELERIIKRENQDLTEDDNE
jgi:chaperonin GroEL